MNGNQDTDLRSHRMLQQALEELAKSLRWSIIFLL